MKTIKFRGKRKYCDEWVKGYYSYLFNDKAKEYIHEITVQLFEQANMDYPYPTCSTISCEVIPETVGQFTGLTDKNGKEIYEGDILYTKFEDKNEEKGYYKVYNEVSFQFGAYGLIGDITGAFLPFSMYPIGEEVVVGNIHDNPDLLNQ